MKMSCKALRIKADIGALVKARRLELGMTTNGLIERLNAMTGKRHSIYQIKNIEDGSNGYTIDLLLNIATVLHLKLDLSTIEQ